MGSSARNRKSGKPDKLKRTPSVAKKLKEFLKSRGVRQDPIKPLDRHPRRFPDQPLPLEGSRLRSTPNPKRIRQPGNRPAPPFRRTHHLRTRPAVTLQAPCMPFARPAEFFSKWCPSGNSRRFFSFPTRSIESARVPPFLGYFGLSHRNSVFLRSSVPVMQRAGLWKAETPDIPTAGFAGKDPEPVLGKLQKTGVGARPRFRVRRAAAIRDVRPVRRPGRMQCFFDRREIRSHGFTRNAVCIP